MKYNNFFNKKGQGLPLNTVVLAILVVLVLVILIVYFTTSMTKSGNDIETNTQAVNACEVGSYIISADDYSDASNKDKGHTNNVTCDTKNNWVRIYSGKTGENGYVCCALKKTSN